MNTSPEHDWWQALRRTVLRVLDDLESASRSDPVLQADLRTLMGQSAQPAELDLADVAPPPVSSERLDTPSDFVPLPIEDETVLASAQPEAEPSQPGAPASALAPALPHVPAEPLPPLRLGSQVYSAPPRYPPNWTRPTFEPARVARSCRFKAEACRWQTRRSVMLDRGEDVAAGDTDLVARARAADVWLWMVSPAKWRERSDEAFAVVAGCYDALADAADLMGLADRMGREQEIAIKLLAEAQSGVRAAVEDYASTRRDEDQEATFTWLREQTNERRVWADFMQLGHSAPPQNHADLRSRIAEVRRRLDAVQIRESATRGGIKRARRHAKTLAGRLELNPDLAARLPDDDDFRALVQAVERLLADGLPPSDAGLREALLDIAPHLPEDVPPALARALTALNDYLDQIADDPPTAGAVGTDDRTDADTLIEQARTLVAGRNAVLIGGRPIERHRLLLEEGLHLASLNWVHAQHHESYNDTLQAIRRPGVGLVVLMTRWRSHRDGPATRQACRERGIPLVELPGGYNLRQVAYRIVEQFPVDGRGAQLGAPEAAP